MVKSKKEFFWRKWGYTKKDFQKWGRKGGLVFKYASNAERQRAYRRRKAQERINKGEVVGILNVTTGRIKKYRTNADRQKAWRGRKGLITKTFLKIYLSLIQSVFQSLLDVVEYPPQFLLLDN